MGGASDAGKGRERACVGVATKAEVGRGTELGRVCAVRRKGVERAAEQAMLLSHVHGGSGKEGCVGLGRLGVGLEREKERVFQRKILFHF